MHLRTMVAGLAALALVGGACSGQDEGGTESPTAVATTAPTEAATPTGTPGNSARGPEGPADYVAERAMEHVRELAGTIGPRVAGTEQEQRAVAYIREQFEASGYSVEVMEFSYEGDRFQAGSVQAGEEVLESLALSGSAGGTVSGKAVFVGVGDAEGIGGRSLEGMIAIADRGVLRFGEKYENVRAAGAAGLVIVNNVDGLFSGSLGSAASIPVVAVAMEQREMLLNAAELGAPISVTAPDAAESTSMNVIARAGAEGECRVVVGGHHDTVPSAPGANDNASGTANVIELARAMAADGLDEGLCFATFGAEESGLFGSAALVSRWQEEGALPEVMLNLDVTGAGQRVDVIGDEPLVTKALDLATELDVPAVRSSLPPNTGSDHQSFARAGVPVIFLMSDDASMIHTPRDAVDMISVESLDRVGRLALAVLRDLAG